MKPDNRDDQRKQSENKPQRDDPRTGGRDSDFGKKEEKRNTPPSRDPGTESRKTPK